ncbi:MAG: polysaccharide biosynthesis/export family protein [Acidobacteria bacterium]|nr:polysaccharide biosynthesis/export family protein [Acidobacteriota bacterium]
MKYLKFVGNTGLLTLLMTIALMSVSYAQVDPPRPAPQTPRRDPSSDNNPGRNTGRTGPDVIMSSDEDYKLNASDLIEVNIEDAPELSGNYRINKSGTIPMKYLGSMQVVGKTSEEVGAMITNGLRGRYLKDPKVYVSVKQYNSRTFFIQGAVRSPGVYVIEGKPSLFKLISIAGGMSENHGSTAYIIRETKMSPEKLEKLRSGQQDADKQKTAEVSTPLSQAMTQAKGETAVIEGESDYELITAHINGLFRGSFEQNLIIQPNDLVYVPPSDVFFVAGEVRAPGQFQLREGTTLRQAISLAQGTYFKSATNKGIIFRQDPATGKLNEIPVDIGAVMSGKLDDVAIRLTTSSWYPTAELKPSPAPC